MLLAVSGQQATSDDAGMTYARKLSMRSAHIIATHMYFYFAT